MAMKEYFFTPQDLLQLLVHYTDGAVPMNGEVLELGVHKGLQRKIGLLISSDEWDSAEPLFLGYDGKRTMSWSKDTPGDPRWEQRAETPGRQ